MQKNIRRLAFVAASLLLFGMALAAYAYFIEPRRLVITNADLRLSNFDSRLDGLRIAAISDIHGGSNYVTAERLRTLVAATNAQNPDVILLLGDYVSQAGDGALKMPMRTIAENLGGFKARYGVFAVVGNHDWWYNDTEVRKSLESVGINVLENEAAAIDINGARLQIWGIEDFWKNRRVPVGPFDKLTDPGSVIAITHNPDSLLQTPSGISLMLAGHSHGGQVNFPIYGRRAFVNDPRLMYGETTVDGKRVFVTGGVGTSVLPFRFRAPPEIAILTVRSE